MVNYKTTTKPFPKNSDISNKNIIEKTILIISVLTVIVSVIITVGEICVAYYELFGDGPYRSLGPMLIVAFLIVPQFIGIAISLILNRWLKKRNLLDDKNRKLTFMPIYFLFFNLLLAATLALVVNISNGNLAKWIHR